MAYKKNDTPEYVQELIKERDKKLSESFKAAKRYLETKKFYELILEDKIDYLNSKDGLILMEGLSSHKLSLVRISECLGINQKQLHEIIRDNPDVYDAIDRGRDKDIDEIELSLQEMAKGYYKEETRTKVFENERGSTSSNIEKYQRYFPANFQAAAYFLQMKREKEWKQKQIDLEVAKNTIKIEVELIGDDELNME